MLFGWLPAVAVELVARIPAWSNLVPAAVVIAAGGGGLLLAGVIVRHGRRKRVAQAVVAQRVRDEVTLLKAKLRGRLSAPASLLAGNTGVAPTMGACEAFEGDIDAAARTVLIEAGGHRTKAKQLLRGRMNAHGAERNGLNGSEVGHWRQLGALSLLDGVTDAIPPYSRAADLAPENAEAQMLVGVLHLKAGNLAAAEAAFRRQIEIGNAANGSGGVARYRGHTMLGDVLAARAENDEAIAAYAEAQRQIKALLSGGDHSLALERDLSAICDRIGDVHLARLDLDVALENYRQSLEIAETLAARDAQNAVYQHDLSVSYDRIGDLLEKKGDREGAIDYFRKSLTIAKTLCLRDPDNTEWQWDLSASYDRIGDALIAQGNLKDALASYRNGLAIAEGLARRDPAHAGWQRDLAISYHKLGSLEAIDNPAEAREFLEKGRAIIDRLARIAAHQAQWRSDLSRFDEVLKTLDG